MTAGLHILSAEVAALVAVALALTLQAQTREAYSPEE
jgi:hypothetical protein